MHGFGPLNWLAGRKVSDLVQETLLQVIRLSSFSSLELEVNGFVQEVEQELRQGLEEQLDQLAIYFQVTIHTCYG